MRKKSIEESKRYVFERREIDGKPTLKVTDNYLKPLTVTVMEFCYTGLPEQGAYAARFLDKLLKAMENINERLPIRTNQMGHTLR